MAAIIVSAWLAWCLLNAALLIAAPLLAGRDAVYTNGLTVVFPGCIKSRLTEDEVAAILAHERGHIVHEHTLKNMARRCLLMPRSEREAFRQELEADDFAAARGHGPALASALRKLSTEPRDLYRAQRLSRL